MKPFATIRDSIDHTNLVVKLLYTEGIQNYVVRAILQIVPLLAAVFIPVLVSQYSHQLTGISFVLFRSPDTFFWIRIYVGLLYFCMLPIIVGVITSILTARFVQAADYALVRLTTLASRYRILGISRTALEHNKVLAITSVGLLGLMLLGSFKNGSFAGFLKLHTFTGLVMFVAVWDKNPLPQVCLILSLIGITILCATFGIAVSAKFRRAIPSYIAAGIGSTIITLLLWLAYTALMDCTYDFEAFLGPGLLYVCHASEKPLLVMTVIPFGLAYGTFRLAERWT